ncbi:dCTP deaminase [Candidatus Uabimicrobium amorphum]|uniref:dCTP deaminase n=1 Tax=Uabimicrobium amorphum TaxID=2596890 RepID=A0A5S9F687_UABAM|nr:dCTP deaminase [Candidatus Uabimicrobium amorphum]BBM87635.1 dCTP deaminase [Candidatus Uabimicrobium amorphum]
MSILTRDEILKAVSAKEIAIAPFDEDHVGPASVDLHLSHSFRVFDKPKKVIRVQNDVDYRKATKGVRLKEGETFLLMPGETILGITVERITLSDGICGWLEGRSKFARVGLLIHISASFMQPGIDNHQVLEMSNFGPVPLEIVPGVRICQFIFQRTIGNAAYQGKFRNQCPEEFSL